MRCFMKYKRIFLIVMDSLGIGEGIDAKKFDDFGTNTFKHISEKFPNGLNIPNLNYLGIADLDDIKGSSIVKHPHSFSIRLNESSNGKDTMTGHWEMMGILTTKPFQTFTDTGFPKELISELEKETGHKLIGNYASSGTEILKKLGEESMKTNSLIIYTSSDSVLQLCGHEETMGLNELYRCCEIARKLTMRPEWFVGRVIARPFIGTNKDNFKRTSNRHDYTISPTGITTMEILKENHYDVKCVGKINDIFNGYGVTSTVHTISNQDGVDKTIEIAKSENFKKGLCFVNLVEFDSEYGHRRNPIGYGNAIMDFDKRLPELFSALHDDDLLMITADHGNDPTYKGTDHTREKVPLLVYSKSINDGRHLSDRDSFADIGETILRNFNLNKKDSMIGKSIEELL
ncbi:MAG TPA: phosphopentomutase [Firmicutes bacterium]|nr:phosphopentomutase [Bacillota bacterium]